MFDRLNAQQQPFIQSGYGAMGRLNTLLGIGGQRPSAGPSGGEMPLGGNASLMPRAPQMMPPQVNNGPYGPGVHIQPRIPGGSQGAPQGMPQNMRLAQILQLRAANGDTEAARILGAI